MHPIIKWTALTLAISLPLSAHAHRAWLLPSATVLSGDAPWITVDAAVSNDLFYFEHFPLQLEGIGQPLAMPARGPAAAQPAAGQATPAPMRRPANRLQITTPDGSPLHAQFGHTGRLRSTFDLQLSAKGTYKLAVASQGLFASWEENGETRRWMGKAEDFAKQVPAKAQALRVVQNSNRMETFITSGAPSDAALAPSNSGLELKPITHPNDLFAGEAAQLMFLIDGKPAADVEVSVIPGGNRYRDDLGEIKARTDAQGQLSITWPAAGMYWLEAEYSSTEGVAAPASERRASYSATLEVLAP
ncbi:DUF4198 domain-containing protein [Pseudomonas fluvialis]|uniref:DUF4198 domain-containing protein n=1 Tax=Pseudomonas fluvialis TaxID=1793966 RepID=UPI00370B634A